MTQQPFGVVSYNGKPRPVKFGATEVTVVTDEQPEETHVVSPDKLVKRPTAAGGHQCVKLGTAIVECRIVSWLHCVTFLDDEVIHQTSKVDGEDILCRRGSEADALDEADRLERERSQRQLRRQTA